MKLNETEKKLVEENGIVFDNLGNAVLKKGTFEDGGSWFLMMNANKAANNKQFFTMKVFIKTVGGGLTVKTINNRVSLARALEIAGTY